MEKRPDQMNQSERRGQGNSTGYTTKTTGRTRSIDASPYTERSTSTEAQIKKLLKLLRIRPHHTH